MGAGSPNKMLLPKSEGVGRGDRRGWPNLPCGHSHEDRWVGGRRLEKPYQTTKVLPLDNPVRITTGVKVAPWGGPGRG